MTTFSQFAPTNNGENSSDLSRTSLRGTSQEPTNAATVSQFSAPGDGDGEVSSDLNGRHFAGLSGAHENGDSFAVRKPPAKARSDLICMARHSVGPCRSPRKWRHVRRLQPTATASIH